MLALVLKKDYEKERKDIDIHAISSNIFNRELYSSVEIQKILGKENLIVYHCTSTYPSNADEMNLLAIKELKKEDKLWKDWDNYRREQITNFVINY